MKQILTIGVLYCILLSTSCKTEKKDKSTESLNKPNIVYILADDLGIGDVSCYGQEKFSTPNIDQLARDGMKFTNHYAGSTVCAPSRSVLLTGQHTGHTYVRGNKSHNGEGQIPLPAETYTIAEMLKKVGYATGAFGKWGLGYPSSSGDPINQGFDTFFGYNCQVYAHRYYPDFLRFNADKYYLEGNDWTNINTYAPDVIQEKALEFMNRHKDQPFFIYLPYTLPHAELLVPDDSIYQKFEDKYEENPFISNPDGEYGKDLRIGGYCSQEKPRATFAAMVTRLDMYVGQVVKELKRLGIYENTVVMFASDNGPHCVGGGDPKFFNSNGNYRGIKRDLYEGGIRSPFLVTWPGKVKAGSITDHVSAFWDVLPTFADLAGVKAPKNIDGISFLPTLVQEGNQKEHECLYWEFFERGGRQAIIKGDWKLVKLLVNNKKKTKVELYNLKSDPYENSNIADSHSALVNELNALINKTRVPSEEFRFSFETKKQTAQSIK